MWNHTLTLNAEQPTANAQVELLRILKVGDLGEVADKWPNLTVSVRDGKDMSQFGYEVSSEELGMPVTTDVLYAMSHRLFNDQDWVEYYRTRAVLLLSAVQLADHLDATAVLSFESGQVIMRRVDGVLHLRRDWWDRPDVLSDVPSAPVLEEDLGIM